MKDEEKIRALAKSASDGIQLGELVLEMAGEQGLTLGSLAILILYIDRVNEDKLGETWAVVKDLASKVDVLGAGAIFRNKPQV